MHIIIIILIYQAKGIGFIKLFNKINWKNRQTARANKMALAT